MLSAQACIVIDEMRRKGRIKELIQSSPYQPTAKVSGVMKPQLRGYARISDHYSDAARQ
jgi:hypothetical protein